MGKVIGIDLGTTNSVCTYMDRRDPVVIINSEGGRITPSVVGISKNGERFVGDIAKRQLLINPEATIHSIKRFMGRRYREATDDVQSVQYKVVETRNGDCGVEVGDRVYLPQEIAAMILQKLRKSAEDFLGEQVTEAVITVPAYFTDRQRQATKDAGTIAGLNVLRIINEPTAAALAYVHDRKRSSTIAVYDFGGGTFDISILEVDRDLAEVRATRGNNALGGADIDNKIVDWLLEQFHREHGIDVSNDKVVLQRLRDAAERAKLELSSAYDTDIHLPFLLADSSGPKHLQCSLSRATFESLAMPLFERTIEECRAALEDCRLRPEDLDEVILVGGSSRIPMIQAMVQDLFKRPLNKSFNPDEVVAIGAAIQAGILEGDVKAVTLLDVTNFSLGIEVEGRRFARLIPKNTTIPTQKTQLVSTVVDNQRTVKIHVLQGESNDARDNVSLGEFELTGIEPAPRGVPRVQVRFAIDSNGIVQVSAKDVRTGVKSQITIDTPTGLSQTEIDELREEHEAIHRRAQDSAEMKELRHQIEKQLVSLENFLRDNCGFLHKKDIFEIEQALKRGRMALLKSADKANLDDLSMYLAHFFAHLADKTGGDAPIH
ncbi:MAG: molecular chaperone DnaK [Alphaproteobacteria bacterium]|nr:molecular chaperone DnaK [Alphaproteobacteria bacterium]MCB9791624.1 molecular chaperone DnaK [Alphaproteobacteria bacterium]